MKQGKSTHLILGGARSGKSSFAETQAITISESQQRQLHYIATAISFDEEMEARIRHHQQRRDHRWQEHEVPLELAQHLRSLSSSDVVLIDCLTLWLNNVIYQLGEKATNKQIEKSIQELVSAVEASPASIIMVSNEVGLGVVPMGQVSRLFVDNAGRMNQALAKVVKQVTFIAAGLPMVLKNEG
jgi:adenosylcobinamide kinase/adenosylcobinamide-phosphate guanylyltransferase